MAMVNITDEASQILNQSCKNKGVKKVWLASKCIIEHYKEYVIDVKEDVEIKEDVVEEQDGTKES